VRIFVDAMCAEFGGIRTYVEHLLGQWHAVFPEDELHVAVPSGSTLGTPGHVRHELAVPRPGVVGRPLAQTTRMRRLVRRTAPDVVLVTVPSTTVLRLAAPMAVVILDLRHELRPEQFSRGRRLLRRVSYTRTYDLAQGFLAISQRSLDDLHELHPSTRTRPGFVTHLGADHVLAWPEPNRKGRSITFAHHTNKNPDLVLDAWEVLGRRGAAVPPLTMLGLSGASRAQVERVIADRHLGEHVKPAPFLPDEDFKRVMAEADLVVFPSDFEGFGLPVVEGMALGKPVVIGPEKATQEISGGYAVVMRGWTAEALADAVVEASALDESELEAARAWGAGFTWERTIRETRAALSEIVGDLP
jgi:glycosyltransferase involved in cell wall biosynthesis